MTVVAVDAGLPHQHRGRQAELAIERCAGHLGQQRPGIGAQARERPGLEWVEIMRIASAERQVGDETIGHAACITAEDSPKRERERGRYRNGAGFGLVEMGGRYLPMRRDDTGDDIAGIEVADRIDHPRHVARLTAELAFRERFEVHPDRERQAEDEHDKQRGQQNEAAVHDRSTFIMR